MGHYKPLFVRDAPQYSEATMEINTPVGNPQCSIWPPLICLGFYGACHIYVRVIRVPQTRNYGRLIASVPTLVNHALSQRFPPHLYIMRRFHPRREMCFAQAKPCSSACSSAANKNGSQEKIEFPTDDRLLHCRAARGQSRSSASEQVGLVS
jgi:hypothetical protein